MIIDCHGHYTTAPAAHQKFREAQLAAFKDPSAPPAKPARISDDEIRETIETNQLKLQKQRGSDLTIFSPRASAMGHHQGDEAISTAWTRANNDLIRRVVDLYPDNFVGVCQLPQSPGVPIANSPSARSTVTRPSRPPRSVVTRADAAAASTAGSGDAVSSVLPPRSR